MTELSDIPKPYKRVYDDKRRKRQLFVKIHTWYGLSLGAKHFYADVYEDSNPIIHNDMLCYFNEDEEKNGKQFERLMDGFNTYDMAFDWTIEIIKEHFSNHKLWEVTGLVTKKEIVKALKAKE
jgi:hypothetical protein